MYFISNNKSWNLNNNFAVKLRLEVHFEFINELPKDSLDDCLLHKTICRILLQSFLENSIVLGKPRHKLRLFLVLYEFSFLFRRDVYPLS